MSPLTIAQIVIPVLLIVLILIQDRSSGISSGSSDGFYRKRRGMEQILFILTIVSIVAFVIVSVLKLVL